jgi:hypothetical protein
VNTPSYIAQPNRASLRIKTPGFFGRKFCRHCLLNSFFPNHDSCSKWKKIITSQQLQTKQDKQQRRLKIFCMAKKYSTATVKSDGTIVPWLAAEGPLAYFPENPPESNYFFQYSWLMPQVYKDKRHFYFGKLSSLSRREIGWGIQPFVDFWSQARTGAVERIYSSTGERSGNGFTTPIACYRYCTGWDHCNTYMLIQHGSYLPIEVAEQPFIKDGRLLLYRGLGKKRTFSWRSLAANLSLKQNSILQRYFDVHYRAFSDSELSFQIAHAWTRRAETYFIQWKMSWFDIADEIGFDPEGETVARWLTDSYRQSFTLLRQMAAWKFGPRYVQCTTPINNVRITSFFAGESEVNVIDPRKVEIATSRLRDSIYETLNLNDAVSSP